MKETFSIIHRSIIAKSLIWKVMFFALLLIILFTVTIGFITWFYEKKEIEEKFNEIQKSYLDVIRRTLWIDDKENLQVILMGIIRLPEIEYADIQLKNNLICMAGSKAAYKNLARTFPIAYTYNDNTYTLGELNVVGSLDYIHQKITKAVLTVALSQASIILCVCILVLFLFYRNVIRRLLKITAYASSLSLDSLGTPLVISQNRRHPDELNILINAINHMQENLHQAFTRQKVVEDQLKQHRGNLENIVEQRTSSLNATNKQLQLEINERKKIEAEREEVIADLKNALAEIKALRGILPICSNCKKIRDDQGYWEQLEVYIGARSEADFSHSICPECAKKLYPDMDIYDD